MNPPAIDLVAPKAGQSVTSSAVIPAGDELGKLPRTRRRLRQLAITAAQSRALRQAVVITLALRIGLGIVGWVALYLYPGSSSPGGISRNPGPPYSSLFEPASSHLFWVVFPWQRWDGLEYQYLASAGYHHASLQNAFYPLYPGLVHATGQLFGHDYGVAALVVSSLLLIPALAVTHQLLRMDCGVVVADRAMLYMAIAPQALFFVAPYTESLFLLLSASSFLLMRRQRFLLASIPAALAVVSRPQGVLLLVPLGIELWIDLRRRRREGRPLLHLGLAAPVPALALAVAWQVEVGRLYPGGQTALQAAWHKVVVVFGVPLVDEVRHLVNMTPSDVPTILDLLMMLLLLGTIPFMVRRLPWAYVGYAVISLIPMMVTETPLEPITSNGRYTLVLFPVFALLALAGRRRWLDRTVMFTFAPPLVLATFHFVHYGKVG